VREFRFYAGERALRADGRQLENSPEMGFEETSARTPGRHSRLPPKGLVHSFAKFFIYLARAAICSSDDWPDVSVAWVAKDREYFLVEAAAVEAAPRTRAETAEFRLLPG
jgi:hypothetical protein